MSLHLLPQLEQDLGLLTWPLLLCAFIALLVALERIALVISERPRRLAALAALLQSQAPQVTEHKLANEHELTIQQGAQLQSLITALKPSKGMLAAGCIQLASQAHLPKSLREEVLALWLAKKRQELQAGLKLLQTVGVIAPLLGLLGTVLGLIAMFTELGQSQGPVTPAQLSQGLGLAMNTTAAGLMIAVPSITAAHLFGFFAQHHLGKIAQVLNHLNLWIEGVNLVPISKPQTQTARLISPALAETAQKAPHQANEGSLS
jgi:biopolymer transport protein ExbB